jgi:hypothetical protein
MKTIVLSSRSRDNILHVEAEGCIVNIHIGLRDDSGHPVTRVDVLCDQYAGEPRWSVDGAMSIGVIVKSETEQEFQDRRKIENMLWRETIYNIRVIEGGL